MIQRPSDKTAGAKPEREPHVRLTIKIPKTKAQQLREQAIVLKHRSVADYVVHLVDQDAKNAR